MTFEVKQYYLSYRPRTECGISQFFKTLQSVNIQDDQSWALSETVQKFPKSPIWPAGSRFVCNGKHSFERTQRVSYSKPLHNKSRCLNTMKSFPAFTVISAWIFVYFQKGFTMKLWQNAQFTTAILFCFIFTA